MKYGSPIIIVWHYRLCEIYMARRGVARGAKIYRIMNTNKIVYFQIIYLFDRV